MTAATNHEIPTIGDLWIVAELERIRLVRSLLGELPAFRRGRMYFDFSVGKAGKVRIAPVEGGAAC